MKTIWLGLTYVICLSPLFMGCTQSGRSTHTIVKEVIGEDNKILYCVTDQDSVRDGLCMLLDSTGKLLALSNYRNGVPHGKHVTFRDNGGIFMSRTMLNGIEEGEYWYFTGTGTVQMYVPHYQQGKMIGSSYYYYESEELFRYDYFDNKGDLGYYVKYHKDGTILMEEGYTVVGVVFEQYHCSLWNGDEVLVCAKFMTASPPDTKTFRRVEFGMDDYFVSRKKDYFYVCWIGNGEQWPGPLCLINDVYRSGLVNPDKSDTLCVGYQEMLEHLKFELPKQ